MSKIGRNDPCPCGSGKKHKHCCGKETAKILPFPGSGFEQEAPESGPGPDGPDIASIMAGFRAELHAALGDRVFENEQELQDALGEILGRRDNRKEADFLGLSPEQMHRILYCGPEGEKAMEGVLSLRDDFRESDLAAAPLPAAAVFLLRRLAETGGVKATAGGNLPRALAQEIWDTVFGPRVDARIRDLRRPRNEGDAWDLRYSRLALEEAGLSKLRSGMFTATKKGTALLEAGNFAGIYRALFLAVGWRLNWNYGRDLGRELDPLLQASFLFNLLLLCRTAKERTGKKALTDAYLRAFPQLYPPEMAVRDREGYGRMMLESKTFFGISYFPLLLGLLETDSDAFLPRSGREPEFWTSPLADRLLEWLV